MPDVAEVSILTFWELPASGNGRSRRDHHQFSGMGRKGRKGRGKRGREAG